ncbi:MAG: YebC/PmpR family DNA-binding transcriptional regulator [Christensenellales bacterium]|jgi:YebC/PmpR family DNA-binding regulatory protein|nr:YebC/PmpR family DNA-binding transcriptional regulator [Clostridiales bacterium]
MAGHSKWANIKAKKSKTDAARAHIFTKIGREIAVAVKMGGPDPENNSRLRDVIAKAKQNNMPNDNILRSIKKASGELNSVNYEEMMYEGYAPGGVAVIVEALTDNKNRTAGDIRHLFDKYGGSLGSTGCVSYLFNRKGVLIVEKTDKTEDDIMVISLEAEADDIIAADDAYEIYTSPQNLENARKVFADAGLNILSSSVEYIPDMYIDPPQDNISSIQKLLEKLEENDDVQNVYHNANLPEEVEEE